jgi:membrane protease YdiL (CAAX protease family)
MHDFLINLPKVLLPLLGIVFLVKVSPQRGLALREDVGFRAPAPLPAVSWSAVWLALTAAEEVVGRRLGIGLAKPWPAYSALVIVERILTIGIMGPIAEELAFRGIFLGGLRRRLNPSGCDRGGSLLDPLPFRGQVNHALTHLYRRLFLWFARLRTRSLWVPISMHAAGNLYSIYQSLHW